MAQATNLVIKDGSSTPVDITFAIERKDPALATWVDRRISVASLQPRISVGFSPANPKRKTDRVSVSVAVPIQGMRDGIAVPVGTNRFVGEFIFAEDTPQANRADTVAYVINALSHTLIKGVSLSRDPIY